MSLENESIETCVYCHINANESSNWFKMVCDVPHLIIWALRKNVKYWPAKVMSIDGSFVKVRFFGAHHLNHEVHKSKCYLYSEKSPGKSNASKPNGMKSDYKTALKVNAIYISIDCILQFKIT